MNGPLEWNDKTSVILYFKRFLRNVPQKNRHRLHEMMNVLQATRLA